MDTIENMGILNENELKLLAMIKLMFSVTDSELLLSFVENIINSKLDINIISVINLFNKLKQNKLDIINNQIVSTDDIENLYENNSSAVSKTEEDGVIIYRFNNQDFKILSSYTNDGLHYDFKFISEITKNCYGYNKLIPTLSVRLSSFENDTIIKFNKDRKKDLKMKPDFMVVKDLTPDILNIAKNNGLRIIQVEGDL
jgi:hypothetical protein